MSQKSTLTELQRRFSEEYIIDFNGTQAAIRAGYSKNGAGQAAAKCLDNSEVQSLIAELVKKQSDRTGVEADKVVNELSKIAFSDVRSLFNEEGDPLTAKELSDKISGAVSSIKITETDQTVKSYNRVTKRVYEYKFWDKLEALTTLLRRLDSGKEPETVKDININVEIVPANVAT
jgi:phage terminase small subunit